MGNRYADDIKRIVGIDPNQSKLGDPASKSAISGKRGIGYYNPKSRNSEGTSGSPGETQLTNTDTANLETGENASGTTGLDPADPQAGVIDSTSPAIDAENIIDGTAPEAKISQPQITDGGLAYANNGSLNAISAVDCDSGDDLEIRIRNDFVPPLGWDDANVTPDSELWTSGTNWFLLDPGTGSPLGASSGNTPAAAASNAGAIIGGSASEAFLYIAEGALNGFGTFTAFYDEEIINPILETSYPIGGASCTLDVDSFCPSVDPVTEPVMWPDDEKASLKLVNGQFVASERDSEVPAKWKNPSSKIDFCFGAGGARTGTVEVTKDNGFMIYETSGGAPTGTIRAYDSTGQLTGAFDGTAGWIDSYRPSTS